MIYQTPIPWAASVNEEILKMVVKARANPFEVDSKGRYAWVCAIPASGKARYDVMRYLLDLELPVNLKLRDGTVPFIDLLTNDDPELVQLFLDRGLDLTLVHRGSTLLEIAGQVASKENLAVISRFTTKSANG
jgi:ankyrin repeat protein